MLLYSGMNAVVRPCKTWMVIFFTCFASATLTLTSYTKLTSIPWRYTTCANMNFLRQGFWKLSSDRQTDRTAIIYHTALWVVNNKKVTEIGHSISRYLAIYISVCCFVWWWANHNGSLDIFWSILYLLDRWPARMDPASGPLFTFCSVDKVLIDRQFTTHSWPVPALLGACINFWWTILLATKQRFFSLHIVIAAFVVYIHFFCFIHFIVSMQIFEC